MKEQILDLNCKNIRTSYGELHRVSDTEFESDIISDDNFGHVMPTIVREVESQYLERFNPYAYGDGTTTEYMHLSTSGALEMRTFCERVEKKYEDVKVKGILEGEYPLCFKVRVKAK